MTCACGCGEEVVGRGPNGLRRFVPGHAYEAKAKRQGIKTKRRSGIKHSDLRALRRILVTVGGGRLAPGHVTLPGETVALALRLVDAELLRRRRKREERRPSLPTHGMIPSRLGDARG